MPSPASSSPTLDMIYMSLFAILIAICSWIALPLTVPFTLQVLGVFLSVGLLGTRRGLGAILLWILLGLAGLPVFSGFRGGPGALLGPTGGYIFGFILSGWAMGAVQGKGQPSIPRQAGAMVLAMLIYYAAGSAWFLLVYAPYSGWAGLTLALGTYVLPFIIPDVAKAALAIMVVRRLRPYVRPGHYQSRGG